MRDFEVFTTIKIQVVVIWLHPEDGGSIVPRNVGILHHYTASQSRRLRPARTNVKRIGNVMPVLNKVPRH
jgi:hypothetical protein